MYKILNFDEDMQQILYKIQEDYAFTCKENRNEEEEIQKIKEISFFSVGKTSVELQKSGIPFFTIRQVANDYNGPNPTYRMVHVKFLYQKNFQLLGAQFIGNSNIERRYEVLKKILEEKKGLKELANLSLYGKPLEEELDILNLASFYGMEMEKNWIPVEQVRPLYEKGAFFLDVREEQEHEYARILGSKNIPLHSLMSRISEIPKDEDVYVYCRSAHRSLDAVNFLKTLGYTKVYNVECGFIGISYEEYTKDKQERRKKIVNRYHFE